MGLVLVALGIYSLATASSTGWGNGLKRSLPRQTGEYCPPYIDGSTGRVGFLEVSDRESRQTGEYCPPYIYDSTGRVGFLEISDRESRQTGEYCPPYTYDSTGRVGKWI